MGRTARDMAEKAKLIVQNDLYGGFSPDVNHRNKGLELASCVLDLWAFALGAVAIVHMWNYHSASVEDWFGVDLPAVLVSLLIAAWCHGILRAQSANMGESLGYLMRSSTLFKQALVRFLATGLLFVLAVFLFIYVRKETPQNTTVTIGLDTNFVNSFTQVFLGIHIFSGLVHTVFFLYNLTRTSKA